MSELNAAFVKSRAKELGADLVGIASAATLNAFPPDPRWPQTPERISPYCKSVIVLVQRIPAGAFRCKTNTPVQYIDMLVLRKMDKVAYRLAEELEDAGFPTFVTAAQETDWNYKRACATEAQEFGFSTILQFFERFIDAPVAEKAGMARSRDVFGFWQGLLRVVGSFGDCPRCLAVCPVG